MIDGMNVGWKEISQEVDHDSVIGIKRKWEIFSLVIHKVLEVTLWQSLHLVT